MTATIACSLRLLPSLRHQLNRISTWWRARGLNQECRRQILRPTDHCNTHASTGMHKRSVSSHTHRLQREAARTALLQEFRPMQTTTVIENSEARAKNAVKFTEWKTDICGARSAAGKKLVCVSRTEHLRVAGKIVTAHSSYLCLFVNLVTEQETVESRKLKSRTCT